MKAVLVIDKMPKNCDECWLHHFEYAEDIQDIEDVCHNAEHESHVLCKTNYKKRPSWCPLRPLPQMKEEAVPYQVSEDEIDAYQDPYATGFNDAIRLITGETE